MKPLKQPENSILCDPSLVDEIFDQIPELLEHHEQFLEQISGCVQNWHEKQKVGDLLVQSVSAAKIPPHMPPATAPRGGDWLGRDPAEGGATTTKAWLSCEFPGPELCQM